MMLRLAALWLLSLALSLCAGSALAQADDHADEFESVSPAALSSDEKAKLQAILNESPPVNVAHTKLLEYYFRQRNAATRLGDYKEKVRVLRNWIDSALPEVDKVQARWRLWGTLAGEGDRAEARAVGEALIPTLGYSVDKAMARAELSMQYLDEFNIGRAEQLQNEAFSILVSESGRQRAKPDTLPRTKAILFDAKARLLLQQGKYAAAAAAAQEAIDASNEAYKISRSMVEDRQLKAEKTQLSSMRTMLKVLDQSFRLYDAEPVAFQLLQKAREYKTGPDKLSSIYNSIADLRIAQGRFTDASKYADKSLSALREAGIPNSSSAAIFAANRKLSALIGLEKWREAKQTLDAQDVIERDAANQKINAGNRTSRALIYFFNGDVDRAAPLMQYVYEENRRQFGSQHFFTAQSAGLYALTLHKQGRDEEARPLFAQAATQLRNPEGVGQNYENGGLRKLYRRLILQSYLELLTGSGQSASVGEAFAIADYLRGSVVQQSVVDAAVRSAAAVSGLGDLVRKEQDGKNEIAALYDFLVKQLAEPPERQLPKVIADMRQRIAHIDSERKATHQKIAQRFPDYDSLIRPQPPTAIEAAKRLADGDALLSILPAGARTYVWVVRRDGRVAFHAAPVSEVQVDTLVKRLRTTLDIGDLLSQAAPAFDTAAAHQLYQLLLAPVAATLQDANHLIVSTSGSLGQLPFAVLLTALETDSGNPAWLVKQAAISHVPSVSAWVALKKQAASGATQQRRPFIGFGDPLFATGVAVQAGATRKINLTRAAGTDPEHPPLSALQYAQLPALPETRDEIIAIATALGADPIKDTFFGRTASRSNVLRASLADRQVIAFATHGLVAGDLPNLTQPALALAATGSDTDSPLLTLEDVLNLKLNADWVVLSACNTAAADGQASEAVSGLGRGFFYAGAKALLVTHWAVESESAKELTTATFKRFGADPAMSRAQALRQAQLEIMSKPGYAHPFFWAPYALIGDGRR